MLEGLVVASVGKGGRTDNISCEITCRTVRRSGLCVGGAVSTILSDLPHAELHEA